MAKKRSSSKAPVQARAAAATAAPSMDVWDRIAWTCLHLLVLLVPIAMSNWGPLSPGGMPLTFDQFDIAKVFLQRGLLLIGLGAWLAGLLVRGGKVRFTKVEWLILAFIAWVALTSVLSIHPPTAVFGKYRRYEGLISFVTYAVGFFLALQLADRPSRIRSLARSLAISGFLVGAYGLTQVIGSVPLGAARIIFPVSIGATVFGVIAVGYLAFRTAAEDREGALAYWLATAFILLGGAFFAAGLTQNIGDAIAQGLSTVPMDPIRWGTLPFEANRAFSTFGNPDLLGGYLIFPWAVSLSLALSEKHRIWRAVYWGFTVLNAFIGLTAYVRGAWIGATVSAVLLVVSYLRLKAGTGERLQPVDKVFIGGGAVVAATVVVASSLSGDVVRNVAARIASIFQFGAGSAFTRFEIWKAALAAIAERPFFGWGADTFRLLFPMFKTAGYVGVAGYLSVADNVHNYPLQLATGIGIPGVLLLYATIVIVLVVSARHVLAKGEGVGRLVYAGLWAAVIGYVVHLIFGLSVTGSTILMWLALGILLAPVARVAEVAAPRWRYVALVPIAALVLTGLVLNVRYVAADNHYLTARVSGGGIEAVNEVKKAIELNPYNDMYRLELGATWRQLFYATAVAIQQGNSNVPAEQLHQQLITCLTNAEDAFNAMIEFEPEEYDTYVFFANLYNEAASLVDLSYAERAVEVATKGIEVEQYGPAIRLQRAMAYLKLGRPEEAIADLEFATELDPMFREAFLALAQAYNQAGRTGDARALLEELMGRWPGNADITAAWAALNASSTP